MRPVQHSPVDERVAGDLSLGIALAGNEEDLYLHDNVCTGNGAMPDEDVAGLAGLVAGVQTAVVWDGQVQVGADATTLCLANTGEFRNIDAPHGFAMPSTDQAPHACMAPIVPPVDL